MLTLLAVKHKIYYLNLHKLAKYEVTTKWKITVLLWPLKSPESNDKCIKTLKKQSQEYQKTEMFTGYL